MRYLIYDPDTLHCFVTKYLNKENIEEHLEIFDLHFLRRWIGWNDQGEMEWEDIEVDQL
jgi:hypothetical protein